MAHGTLENLSHSSFVRTPTSISERIYRYLLSFPSHPSGATPAGPLVTVLDPAAGEGDLLLPLLDLDLTCRIACTGIEISADRAATARTRLAPLFPTVLPSAIEGVKLPDKSISLAVLNPPYFFVNGRRAEYRFVTRTTEALVDNGILVALLPARSAWDHKMVTYWSRWFDAVRVWKVPSLEEGETESPFEKYTQIVVVGRKRVAPRDLDDARIQELLAYRWRKDPKHNDEEYWAGQVAPPTLPAIPIDDPYVVPAVLSAPYFEIQNADEALILETLLGTTEQPGSGAHLSAEWAQATTWQEETLLERPAMPYTGVAHVAAEIMTGMLGGEVIDLNGTPYLLTAFVGSEWSKMTLDADTRENLRTKGVIKASARQLQDYPVLGVLDLSKGQTRYYEGNAVFDFLSPWISTLASYAQQKRPPLYQLDPEEWELRVLTQFGIDKQLPQAPFPGLAPAQMHRVCAMGRTLDERGLVAIQGEPGTGKTRLSAATAARQAYAWQQHRTMNGYTQPQWMRQLRRAWLKNPRTRAMLHLEPVYGERLPQNAHGEAQIREEKSTRQIVAYRRIDSGELILPEQAGPRSLPVLVTTPKKVTKEFAREINAAWPQAETIMVQRYDDITHWFQRCAVSEAPAVIAICSHSQSQPRGSGRSWEPAMLEMHSTEHSLVTEPAAELLPGLEEILDPHGQLIGYRSRATGEPLVEARTKTHYRCPDCFGLILGIPDRLQPAKTDHRDDGSELLQQEDEEENESLKSVVTSRGWFEKKPRWCTCAHTRNAERTRQHQKSLRTPLWTQARVQTTQQKYPALSYQEWTQVIDTVIQPPLRERVAVDHVETAQKDPCQVMSARQASRLTRTSEGMATIQVHHAADPLSVDYYDQIAPPPDSFGVYEYLNRFFKGCVALSIVDESHNGRAQNSDIARALHRAMRAAQSHMLTSGTHYGGDVASFYFYWYRFNPRFWKRLGLTWKQASEALHRYGVIQMWVKEYESDARRGSGKSNVQVSTVPAPGLSAKLLPSLLEDLCFLTVLDVGAFMPAKVEIPEIVSMQDPQVDEKARQAEEILVAPRKALAALQQEKQRLFDAVRDGVTDREVLQEWSRQEEQAQLALIQAQEESAQLKAWVHEHDLLGAYLGVVKSLADRAQKGNPAARMAQGTIPRWFAVLPCEKPYELWQTKRSIWGDAQEKQCLLKTPQLAWDYVYPLEKRLLEVVQKESAEGRRLMLYIDQNQERSTARRLEWVLQQAGVKSWTLPNTVKPEDRQQRIIESMSIAPEGGAPVSVAIVPYSRVNEGINLQSVVDTIIWVEMALNLFMLEQASRRAWRLGKREEVRIYYLAYAGTVGHQKMRKLGAQSGAAAAFAGEPARGALIEEAGADETTLARFSATVEAELLIDEDVSSSSLLSLLSNDDTSELTQAFERRANEESQALKQGRTWFGASDTLPDRLPVFYSSIHPDVWAHTPTKTPVQRIEGISTLPPRTDTRLSTSEPSQELPYLSEVILPSSELPAHDDHTHQSETFSEEIDLPMAFTPVALDKAPVVNSTAPTLLFGNVDHIALARQRATSKKKKGTIRNPKSNTQVHVRDIPIITPSEEVQQTMKTPHRSASQKKSKQVSTAQSLWDFVDTQITEHVSDQYNPEQSTPVSSKPTIRYAIWQIDLLGTLAIRYFVDDHTPVEKRHTGFHRQEEALAFLQQARPDRNYQAITFQLFSHELAERAKNECLI
ncbi:hypothetical protein KDW_31030 [Dictyobacter vulcani]|uniref:DUF6094 domain-containing protein n=1 Tax=Dictyobacter vulcani TaxID=2607529 RepID=A0A5J4KR99_9CHLR|nr:DUF6094 domain-containing protein [Dictyobacter vulcani]GER88941.1 hypothetical protein KDW_31030 [Dictyobacter vulcani]